MEEFAENEGRGAARPRLVTPWLDYDLRGDLLRCLLVQAVAEGGQVVLPKPHAFAGNDDEV